MKITEIKTTVLQGNFLWPIVRVETDEGIIGYGEMRNHYPAKYKLDAHSDPKELAYKIKPLVLGEDPTNIPNIWQKIYASGGRGRSGGGVSAIETACWDIIGKARGLPVYQLLGGKVRDKVRIYCDCRCGTPVIDCERDYLLDEKNYTPEAYAANAKRIEAMGFTGLKFDIFGDITIKSRHVAAIVEGGIEGGLVTDKGIAYEALLIRAAREALKPETELAVDCAVYRTAHEAIRFGRAVEDLKLAWLEDVLPDDDVGGWREVTATLSTPTLAGENIYTANGFLELLENQGIRISAADLMTVGGMNQAREAARLAENHGMKVAPHFAGSPVGMMANVHVAATIPNLIALEFHAVGVPWWERLIRGPKPLIEDGHISVPDLPGLGFEFDEDECRRHLAPGETFFD